MNRVFIRFFQIFSIIVISLMYSQSAIGQYIWNVSHSDFSGRYYYVFDALSCSGNTCTAAGLRIDTLEHRFLRMFWRTTNAGLTWSEQNSGLQFDTISSFYDVGRTTFRVVDQISRMNTVVAGSYIADVNTPPSSDNCFVVYTSDGGKSWQHQGIPISGVVRDLNFFDAQNGILLAQKNIPNAPCKDCGPTILFSTSDGGAHWDSSAVDANGSINCVQFGTGKFALFKSSFGGYIYSTSDNWKSSTSIGPIIDSITDPQRSHYRFSGCQFSGPDTIIVFGEYNTLLLDFYNPNQGVILRSTDGGKHWDTPLYFSSFLSIQKMSSLDRDTVLAGGESGGYILMSTDRGANWRIDSVLLDSAYSQFSLNSISITSSGKPLAIYCFQSQLGVPSIIIGGKGEFNTVAESDNVHTHNQIFPNPALHTLNISLIEQSSTYKIVDIVGRMVLSGRVSDHTTISIEVGALPRGMYYVLIENPESSTTTVEKLMLIEE